MKNLLQARWLLATLAGTLLTTLASAQPAVEWSGGQADLPIGPRVVGIQFKVTPASDIEVRALGAYDADGDGLAVAHGVAIWPLSGGSPLVTATVPAGTAAFLEGHFRYVNITPVRLFKGTEYVIAASDFGGPPDSTPDSWAAGATGFTNSPFVTLVTNRFFSGAGLNFPTGSSTASGFRYGNYGGNFTLHPVPTIPTNTVRVSQLEVCWNSDTNVQYRVEYKSALTTNEWVTLLGPLPGTGTNNCVSDPVAPGTPQRFYRVLALPCAACRSGFPKAALKRPHSKRSAQVEALGAARSVWSAVASAPLLQTPRPRSTQPTTERPSWCLELGVYLVFGVWCLVFSTPRLLFPYSYAHFPEILFACRTIHSSFFGRGSAP